MKILTLISLSFVVFVQEKTETLTVITSNGDNKITKFENAYFKQVIDLYNKSKKTKVKFKVKYNYINSFRESTTFVEKALGNNRIIGINQISIAPEILPTVDYSSSYLPIREALIVLKSSHLKELDKSLKIAGPKATKLPPSLGELQKKYTFKVKLFELDGWRDALFSGDVDALYGDNILAFNHVNELRIFAEYGPDYDLGFIYPRNSSLRAKLEPFIRYFTGSAGYYKLLKDYFGDRISGYFRDIIKKRREKQKN